MSLVRVNSLFIIAYFFLRERLALMDLRALSDPKDLVEIMVYPVLLVKLELLDLVDLTDPLERKVHV